MTKWLLTGICWILTAGLAFAQNPCTDPLPSGVVIFSPATSRMYVETAQFTATDIDGSQLITDVQFAYFAEGAPITGTPLQGPSTMPKSGFALAAGTTNCYSASPVPPVPTGQRLVAVTRFRHAAANGIQEAFSPWSAVSNPFGLGAGAPLPPTRTVIR